MPSPSPARRSRPAEAGAGGERVAALSSALPWGLSLVAHGAIAALLFLLPAEARRMPDRPPIEIVERKERPQERRREEPRREPKKAEAAEPKPLKLAMTKKLPPPKRAEDKPAPEPKPVREPEQPDTGPKTFGLKLEGKTTAPGTGVPVPRGDAVEVSPQVTKKGPPRKVDRPRTGFKDSYGRGEEAPVAVLTKAPKVLRQVTAEYPEKMRELGIEGRVVLELHIDEQGRVIGARVVTSLRAELDAVAMVAARKLLFSPALVNGSPVKTKIPYVFTFVLD